ncbi:MAG: hypothetical protein ABF258_01055 [Flavobacteriales bacterium]
MKNIGFFLFLLLFYGAYGQSNDSVITILKMDLENKNLNRKTFISQLNDNESFVMKFESRGCFHFNKSKLIISKKSGEYFVEYLNKRRHIDFLEHEIVHDFEMELYQKDLNNYCTTQDYYTITSRKETLTIIDGSCSWRGFQSLLSDLKLK